MRVNELTNVRGIKISGHGIELEFRSMAGDKDRNAQRLVDGDGTALTPRELECLKLVADGLHDADIGKRLEISKSTVAMHVTNARRKLRAKTREQAIASAFRSGLMR